MPKIRMPDGAVVAFPDDMSADQIKSLIASKFPDAPGIGPSAGQQFQSAAGDIMKGMSGADQYQGGNSIGVNEAARQGYLEQMKRKYGPDAATMGSQAGVMGGFDDEIGALMTAPINATIKRLQGADFNVGREYTKTQQQNEELKAQAAREHPGWYLGGQLAGGAALAGQAANNGLTLFGRTSAPLAALGEGEAYGALYGAGEAKPGERLAGAERGAVTGGVTGLLLHGAGKIAEKAFTRPAASTAAPAADVLHDQGKQLYDAMEQMGVTIKPSVIKNLQANIALTLGKTEPELAPTAFALQKMANRTLTDQASIGDLHNFAMAINQELRGPLKGADAKYVPALKNYVESLISQGSGIANVPGNQASQAFKMWKQADEIWTRYKKADTIQRIMDQADVNGSGQYTQSGLANAVRREMNTLYKSIKKGRSKGWTQGEIALIRQMAKGGSNSQIINLLAKFAPRGVVSGIGGFALGGPGLVLGGHIAGQMADRGAANAIGTLRNAAALGYVPQPIVPQIAPKLDMAIPALTGPANELRKSLVPSG